MRKIIALIFIQILMLSCNLRTQDVVNDLSFKKFISDSDQLVIKLYDTTITESSSRNVESFKPKKVFKVNKEKIIDFENIIENSKQTDYCCCPTSVYSISFLKKNKEVVIFYVDTFEFKDKIRIYEGSFQYSYIVEKQKWKNFLNKEEN